MTSALKNILQSYSADADGIFCCVTDVSTAQNIEIALRERVAAAHFGNYLDAISRSHSIGVMDHEVDIFLAQMPPGALILDVGGCWGWHWRHVADTRPDIGVLIIDFVRANLLHAKNVLGELVGEQVILMHADATAIPFSIDSRFLGFDGIWSVQTLQHVPDFDKAVTEAFRVLRPGGLFANYSLNVQAPIRWIKRFLGKDYHTVGWIEGNFWLARASQTQKRSIETICGSKVTERWSEILYSPELHFPSPGKVDSWLGKFDALLSNNVGFFGWLARQHSFHCRKS